MNVHHALVTNEPVGALSQIRCEPGMLVTNVVTKGGSGVTKRDPTLDMYQGCDNTTSGKI